jgi:hypothetical protein
MQSGHSRSGGVFLAFILMLAPPALATGTPKKPHVPIAIVPAKPEDVSNIEAIIKADYESISGGVGVSRDWGRDLSLYDPHARSFVVWKNSKTGALETWTPTQQEYADEANAHFVQTGFVERETSHQIRRFGNVATVFSAYEGKLSSTGELYTRGVNVYQLYFDGKRWWISSISWDAERLIGEIPRDLSQSKGP